MTKTLQDQITAMIRQNGPLRIHDYMSLCLTDPEFGYYTTADPLGTAGDFTTAPEISQMFGELIGLWLYDEAIKQRCEETAVLLELGPGRGTLMADALRCFEGIAPHRNWAVHLAEINPALIALQHQNLAAAANAKTKWQKPNDPLPPEPLLVIANEFFDALPIRQFKSRDGVWLECAIALDDDMLTPTLLPQDQAKEIQLPPPSEDGLTAEYCPQIEQILAPIASHISQHGGAMLIIDYGKTGAIGDSLQAVQSHKPVDILHEPGKTDLSAWVDFAALADHARAMGLDAFGPAEQGSFLKAIGLYHRAEQLAAGAEPETRRQIAAAVDRLSSPAQMGSAFKVMALRPTGLEMPVAGIEGL